MQDWIKIFLDLLTQFTGGRGGIDNIIVNYGIAAMFYAILFTIARVEFRNSTQPRDHLLMWGFAIGCSREMFMIFMAITQAFGLVAPVNLHVIFPPLEHALLDIAMVLIAGGYIQYFINDFGQTRRYLLGGITTTVCIYLATFWWWGGYILANPTSKFGKVWCDWLFHINASFWLFISAILIFNKSKLQTRNIVTLALFLFALSNFLKLPDMALDEVYEYVFEPIARANYLVAIFILGYVYFREQLLQQKVAEQQIQNLAFYDTLTRLPNRRLLQDRLQQALASTARHNQSGSLLFIDLDNFKNLNDTLGHAMGDKLLQQVTQRLVSCIRAGDTVARLGGDEFVVMLLDLSGQPIEAATHAEVMGEKILAALSQPYQLDKNIYRCTASIGVTLFRGNQQATDELMKQADIAMYQAKKAGRNALRFFDREMQENISARVSMESELHNAIEFQQFQLHYQIQVDSGHCPLGAEALIRWIHPVRGLVFPAQFIPLAEETGLILPIGLWVLDTVCSQLNAWQKDALTRDLTLAVNVSARQFRQADFVEKVQAAVRRHSINPKLLKLELTESLLQENIEETIATMDLLNETGVRFSLDDFGTGYSSLQYLKRLPLDQIKIDQSFIRDIASDINDKMIVRTIIIMSQSLNLNVIAEGVETEDQRQFLLNNGCTNYQGYLFGRPVQIEQFEASLKHR